MKIHKNNRNERVREVAEVVAKLTNPCWDQELVLLEVFKSILEKKKQNSYRQMTVGSRVWKRSMTDTYERALGSVLLYCFKNSIPTTIGYFYFIKSQTYEGFVKMGHTQDVETRLHSYQTHTPFRDFYIDRYVICKNARKAEDIAMRVMKDSLVQGEWISSENSDADFIRICSSFEEEMQSNRFSYSLLKL